MSISLWLDYAVCIDWALQPSVHFIMTRLRRVHWLSSTTECPFHYDSTTSVHRLSSTNRMSISLWLDYAVCIDWAVQPNVHFIMTRLRWVHRLSTTTSVHFIMTRLRRCIDWTKTECPFHYDLTTPCALIEQVQPNVHFIMTRLRGVHRLSTKTECPFHYWLDYAGCIDWALQPNVHFIMTRLQPCALIEQYNRVSISFMTRLRRVHWLSSTNRMSISLWLDYAGCIDWALQTECPFHYDSTTPECIDWAVQPNVHFIMTRLRRGASIEQYNRMSISWLDYNVCIDWAVQPSVHFIMTRLQRVHWLSSTTADRPFSLWLDYAVCIDWAVQPSVHFIMTRLRVCIDWAVQPNVHFIMTGLRRVHRLSSTTECPFHYDSTTGRIDWAVQPSVHFIMTRLRRVHWLSSTTECPFHYDSTTPGASIEH